MRITLISLVVSVFTSLLNGQTGNLVDSGAKLIKEPGEYKFTTDGVTIAVRTFDPALDVRITYNLPSFRGTTGTGDDSPLRIAPHQWAIQFEAPNQTWIYNGIDRLWLFERTVTPSGFKASESISAPRILDNAPKAILNHIAEIKRINERKPSTKQ